MTLDTEAATPAKRSRLYVNLADVYDEMNRLADALSSGHDHRAALAIAKSRVTTHVDMDVGNISEFTKRLDEVLFKHGVKS